MPMVLNISTLIWQSYINAILDCLQSRNYCEIIMDFLLLFMSSKESHIAQLEDLLNPSLKSGLKLSPKKYLLFRKELQYMGDMVFIEDRRVCIKSLRSRLVDIQKLRPPMTVKGCRCFVAMVNFLSIFCPELQKLLKHIYNLVRKGKQFISGEEQQIAFEEIKHKLVKLPVLHLPENTVKIPFIFRYM